MKEKKEKKEIELHLNNFRFAIEHCTATKMDFIAMETSYDFLSNLLLKEEPKKPNEA